MDYRFWARTKFLALVVCSFVFGYSLKAAQADLLVAKSLNERGYFASKTASPILTKQLMGELRSLFNNSHAWPIKGDGGGAHQNARLINWKLNIIKQKEESVVSLASSDGKSALPPKPVRKAIRAFFRFFPNGKYKGEFVLSDDVALWVDKQEAEYQDMGPGFKSTISLKRLYWHQDKFIGSDFSYRYLGFCILGQQGLSLHMLGIGLAPKEKCYTGNDGAAPRYDHSDVDVVHALYSVPGATYLIDQNWSKEGQVLVHTHTGYHTFFCTSNPTSAWSRKESPYKEFFESKFPNYMDFASNNIRSSSYKKPRRQKLIFRILPINEG